MLNLTLVISLWEGKMNIVHTEDNEYQLSMADP